MSSQSGFSTRRAQHASRIAKILEALFGRLLHSFALLTGSTGLYAVLSSLGADTLTMGVEEQVSGLEMQEEEKM